MLEYFVEAELANRRREIERRGRAGHRIAGPNLLQRFREARRRRRDPVQGASRYELDGPLTRRTQEYWINAATHH
jgi:hypothetical protein